MNSALSRLLLALLLLAASPLHADEETWPTPESLAPDAPAGTPAPRIRRMEEDWSEPSGPARNGRPTVESPELGGPAPGPWRVVRESPLRERLNARNAEHARQLFVSALTNVRYGSHHLRRFRAELEELSEIDGKIARAERQVAATQGREREVAQIVLTKLRAARPAALERRRVLEDRVIPRLAAEMVDASREVIRQLDANSELAEGLNSRGEALIALARRTLREGTAAGRAGELGSETSDTAVSQGLNPPAPVLAPRAPAPAPATPVATSPRSPAPPGVKLDAAVRR